MTEDIDMSDAITRFSPFAVGGGCDAYGDMEDDTHGDWVRYEDYEALTARAAAAEMALAKVTDDRDEYAERTEELERACEIVSGEFEGELWQSCRRLLQKTGFDFHGADVDGIQADDFEGHINETLAEFDSLTALIATIERETLERVAQVANTFNAAWFRKTYDTEYKRKMYQPFRVEANVNQALNIQSREVTAAIRAMIEEKTDG